jgi:hypothetical protein
MKEGSLLKKILEELKKLKDRPNPSSTTTAVPSSPDKNVSSDTSLFVKPPLSSQPSSSLTSSASLSIAPPPFLSNNNRTTSTRSEDEKGYYTPKERRRPSSSSASYGSESEEENYQDAIDQTSPRVVGAVKKDLERTERREDFLSSQTKGLEEPSKVEKPAATEIATKPVFVGKADSPEKKGFYSSSISTVKDKLLQRTSSSSSVKEGKQEEPEDAKSQATASLGSLSFSPSKNNINRELKMKEIPVVLPVSPIGSPLPAEKKSESPASSKRSGNSILNRIAAFENKVQSSPPPSPYNKGTTSSKPSSFSASSSPVRQNTDNISNVSSPLFSPTKSSSVTPVHPLSPPPSFKRPATDPSSSAEQDTSTDLMLSPTPSSSLSPSRGPETDSKQVTPQPLTPSTKQQLDNSFDESDDHVVVTPLLSPQQQQQPRERKESLFSPLTDVSEEELDRGKSQLQNLSSSFDQEDDDEEDVVEGSNNEIHLNFHEEHSAPVLLKEEGHGGGSGNETRRKSNNQEEEEENEDQEEHDEEDFVSSEESSVIRDHELEDLDNDEEEDDEAAAHHDDNEGSNVNQHDFQGTMQNESNESEPEKSPAFSGSNPEIPETMSSPSPSPSSSQSPNPSSNRSNSSGGGIILSGSLLSRNKK